MTKHSRFLVCFSTALVVAMIWNPPARYMKAAPPQKGGQEDARRDDHCAELPNPPGNAYGIHKHCPVGGSSSGIRWWISAISWAVRA